MQCEIRRRGVELGLGDDHVKVSELARRSVPQPPLLSLPREGCVAATTVAVSREGIPAHVFLSGVEVKEPELPRADALLIVEDLLLQARTLSASDAPTEAIEAILDHVAALREGRG